MPSAEKGGRAGRWRFTSRVIRGGLPRSAGRSMSTGVLPNSGSRTSRWWSSVATPTTANGQRSRSQSDRKRSSDRGRDREHVALLRLVRPDLARGHARLLVRGRPQVDARAPPGAVDELGERVRDAAGPDVVDREDGVRGPERPAAVDDLLGPALDLGVAALHGVEVEVGGVGAGRHRGGRPAAHADEHPGAAELDEQGARRDLALVGVAGAHVAHPARDHDRLVVAAHDAGHLLLVGAEVAGEVGPPELVVEGGGADRPLGHDREGRGDPVGARLLPSHGRS